MSETLKKDNRPSSKIVAGLAATSIALSMGAGSASAETKQRSPDAIEMANPPKDRLDVQRKRETVSFQRFGKNINSLPGIIDTTLKANYPGTLGFLPGQTDRYALTVGDPHHGTTTMRTVYSDGKLHALTMIENFDDPMSFRKLKDSDEYIKMVREKNGGWRVEKNEPASSPEAQARISSSISVNLIPGYRDLPKMDLGDRQSAVVELNAMNRNLEVFVKDLQQFGIAPETKV